MQREIPDDPLPIYITLWGPGQEWAEAFSPLIHPVADPALNQQWGADVASVVVKSVRNPVPFTLSDATLQLSSTSINLNKTEKGFGAITGTGSGKIQYTWEIEKPDGATQVGKTLSTKMGNGVANLSKFSLPSNQYGTYRAWIHIVSPADSALTDSESVYYTVPAPQPGIVITSVPAYGVFQTGLSLSGKVSGVDYHDYKVAVYLFVDGGWWTKPFWDSPATTIASNNTFSTNVVIAGDDHLATQYRAYLVPIGFDVPLAAGGSVLSDTLLPYLYTDFIRQPA